MTEKPIKYVIENHRLGQWDFRLKRVQNLDDLIDRITDELFNRDERLPYWGELWPSAIGLSHFLIRNPDLIEGKSTLELGVGLGLTSMVLQKLNPSELLLTDYEREALDLVKENFGLNRLPEPAVQLTDWRSPDFAERFERIVASDILYEERFFDPLIRLFKNSLASGGKIIIAEPNRAVAKKFFQSLHDHGFRFKNTIIPVVQTGKTIQVNNFVIYYP